MGNNFLCDPFNLLLYGANVARRNLGRESAAPGRCCMRPASVRAGSESILYFQNTQCDSEPQARHTGPVTWRPANVKEW